MTTVLKTRASAIAAAALLVLAGCGGGKSDSGSKTTGQSTRPPATPTATSTPASAPQPAKPAVYVHQFIDLPALAAAGPLRVQPAVLKVRDSSGTYYRMLRWHGWGAATATATGQQCATSPLQPGGSGGHVAIAACFPVSARIVLSDLRSERGKLVYLRSRVREQPGVSVPYTQGTRDCGDVSTRMVALRGLRATGMDCLSARGLALTPQGNGFKCGQIGTSTTRTVMVQCVRGRQAIRSTNVGD